MKKLLAFILIISLILTVAPQLVLANQDTPTFKAINGSWSINGNSVSGGGSGNVFCSSDLSVGATDSWTCTVQVTDPSGHGIGLMFGLSNPNIPTELWNCLMLGKNDNIGIVFSETNATNDYIFSYNLPDSFKSLTSYELKLVCVKGESIKGYINDHFVADLKCNKYNGGYFGVMCCNAQASFSDLTLTINDIPHLSSLESSIALDLPFSKAETNYWANTFNTAIDLTATAPDGVSVSIQDTGSSSATVNLIPGLNVIPIKLTGKTGSNTVYINVIRHNTEDLAYSDTYRQQLHYSNEMFSINDPNGLIYDETTGIYHLMFQSDFPLRGYKVQGDSKHWGHAVSRNLIDWQYVGPAIEPDENGVIWSGSGVIDRNNTSGLFDESTPEGSRMVFLYTYYGEKTHGGTGDLGLCSIGLAYSDDHGQTFKKYDQVVIPNKNNRYSSGFRDPKVIWYEDETMENGGIWFLIACGDKAMIFTSPDLINWEYQSTVKDINGRRTLTTECPDLFPLEYEGTTKWILFASGTWYVVGDLGLNENGKMTFTTQSKEIWPTNGVVELWGPGSSALFPEAYAAQTFYNTELDRRIQMSWIRDFGSYGGKLWYSTLSLPTEITLTKIDGEYRIAYKPIKELEQKRADNLVSIKNKNVAKGENPLANVNATLLDIHAVIDPLSANKFGFILHDGGGKYIDISYDAKKLTAVTDKTHTDSASAYKYETSLEKRPDGTIEVRIILDTHSVEVWFNNTVRHLGNAYITNAGNGYEFYCDSDVKIVSMEVYELNGMNRNSITDDANSLNALYGQLKDLAADDSASISALKEAILQYNALSSGQKYCMPSDTETLVLAISARIPNFPTVPVIIGAAVILIISAITVIIIKKRKRS